MNFTNFTCFFKGIDSLVDPIKSICTSKVKSNSVKQENEKLEDLKKSAIRAFMALLSIPDAGKLLLTAFKFKKNLINPFSFTICRQSYISC